MSETHEQGLTMPEPIPEEDSPIHVAINMSKVRNDERSRELMGSIGPKVCITTAEHPGFVGFQANLQVGALPMAGRWGGASVRMDDLNPIRNWQYTMWDSYQAHDEFHEQQFDRIFELCTGCTEMVVEGPWEPVYSVVAARMPRIKAMSQIFDTSQEMMRGEEFVRFATPQRGVACAPHTVKPGHEEAFEKGVIETLEALLQEATGFLGYMVLKQIGVCPLGSFRFDPKSMGQALESMGAVPPDDPKPAFATEEARPSPPEYMIHTEWDAVELARLGFGKTLVNHRIRKIHDEGVMEHVINGPYIMFFEPMMEEDSWRDRVRTD